VLIEEGGNVDILFDVEAIVRKEHNVVASFVSIHMLNFTSGGGVNQINNWNIRSTENEATETLQSR
jgi:hypothetical protein